ncbi:hypothetical protein CNMCM5623_008402 [Aspergillus felis]|uniref:Uncharacterized protein n=1 Tax=Aspergillus felis TaxID=1287682 RepID=A0A8H6PZH9_9EURO|nr:hypothetical protein CNMCM5623_008402 [Aspergillus felis]KAF7176060.1 hypothetical protein CNMCM7691_001235 [Aspergillus felis]
MYSTRLRAGYWVVPDDKEIGGPGQGDTLTDSQALRKQELLHDERARITRVIEEMGHDVSALPERFQRELGVPQLRSNLTEAKKLRVIELDGEWAAAKQEREAAHQRRKEAKAAWEEAERAWV